MVVKEANWKMLISVFLQLNVHNEYSGAKKSYVRKSGNTNPIIGKHLKSA